MAVVAPVKARTMGPKNALAVLLAIDRKSVV
jgi:hypothetical protein